MWKNDNKRKRSASVLSPGRSESDSYSIDDSIGHIDASKDDVLHNRYIVRKEMGTGTFGTVLKCYDKKHEDFVAIKVVRKIARYTASAKIEADILRDICNEQARRNLKSNRACVKMYSCFQEHGHFCMVFEPLGLSVYELIKKNNYVGLPLCCMSLIARQLLEALDFLYEMKLIHTDLKLENILFVSRRTREITIPAPHAKPKIVRRNDSNDASSSPNDHSDKGNSSNNDGMVTIKIPTDLRVRLIDFGGATYDDEHKSTIVNTRQYRGPEVTLELGWSYPSDVWSLGCILAEIYAGDLLFATHDSLEHLCLMEQCLGPFPKAMLNHSPLKRQFFHSDGSARFDDLDEESRRHVKRMPALNTVFSLWSEREREYHGDIHCMSSGSATGNINGTEETGDGSVVGFMKGLLRLDPQDRLTAREALQHPFVLRRKQLSPATAAVSGGDNSYSENGRHATATTSTMTSSVNVSDEVFYDTMSALASFISAS